MKKALSYLRNKFVLATVIFLAYTLFLSEDNIFTLIRHSNKLDQLETSKAEIEEQLLETRSTLDKLNDRSEVERFAREKKYFKKDDEDIFVIFYD
ncbi:MAG: septum formation initiator family protein [Crocinitomicaceae bacterium]|nr:septum formation initiator family protein [Crocinitomicaceae bacterium]MDG1658094.1 septum formation initiator family protein [Crocinitomicaceae bacterium]MDG2440359.1 septum formation initiator family protein [Crocinitomicaceae bacterium]